MRQEEIRREMYAALKAHDGTLKESLSMLLQALQKAEKEKRAPLTEAEEGAVVSKEIKQLRETISSCPKDRTDIINACTARIALYEKFMPKQLSRLEIHMIAAEVLSSLGLERPTAKDKGKIMKALMPQLKGRADGREVSIVVDGFIR
jgi:uncharacterized protein YqeY